MAKKQNQETQSQEIAVAQPTGGEIAKVGEARGFESGGDNSDLIMPRAKLLQAMSPELNDDDTPLKKGQIINSLTKEMLPAEFVPIFTFKEFLKFNPKQATDPNFNSDFEPGALMWKTRDVTDPRVKECDFGPDGEKPTALATLNFLAMFIGQPMPVIISFSKTSYKTGKKLYTMTRMFRGDMFAQKYKLTATKARTKSGEEYYTFDVASAGAVAPEVYAEAEALWKDYAMHRENIQAHTEE